MDGTLAPSSRAAARAGSVSDVRWGPEPDWGHPGDPGVSLLTEGSPWGFRAGMFLYSKRWATLDAEVRRCSVSRSRNSLRKQARYF